MLKISSAFAEAVTLLHVINLWYFFDESSAGCERAKEFRIAAEKSRASQA